MNEVLEKIIKSLHVYEREAEVKARADRENRYNWGFADGMRLAKQIAVTELMKHEKANTEELAR